MNRHPFDSHELGRAEPELDRVGQALERHAAEESGEPPLDLASRIRSAVDAEPARRGPFAGLLATWRSPVRAVAAAVVVLAAVVGALALGELADRARDDVGATPGPSVVITPSPIPTPTPSPSPSPSPTPSSTPSPTPSVTPSETAEPSSTDDDEVETPEPSESDNSGPGGGGGSDNSGPGSGDDSGG